MRLNRAFGDHTGLDFNPRIPRGMRRLTGGIDPVSHKFQSTHPARDATKLSGSLDRGPRFQSTHPARDATPPALRCSCRISISIHASREGCHTAGASTSPIVVLFQSTHPARDATRTKYSLRPHKLFQSTHPARDATDWVEAFDAQAEFQSTHPARDATEPYHEAAPPVQISIHASREGCDRNGWCECGAKHKFQSTHPARDATFPEVFRARAEMISIHASREGCD